MDTGVGAVSPGRPRRMFGCRSIGDAEVPPSAGGSARLSGHFRGTSCALGKVSRSGLGGAEFQASVRQLFPGHPGCAKQVFIPGARFQQRARDPNPRPGGLTFTAVSRPRENSPGSRGLWWRMRERVEGRGSSAKALRGRSAGPRGEAGLARQAAELSEPGI